MSSAFHDAVATVTDLRTLGKELAQAKTQAQAVLKSREINERIGDTLEKLLTAQMEYSTLLSTKSQLEAEVAALQDWAKEKQRYQLHQTEAGSIVYVVKPGLEDGEPAHQLCARCYQDGVKAFLQPAPDLGMYKMLKCHDCKSDIQVKRCSASVEITPGPERGRGWKDAF